MSLRIDVLSIFPEYLAGPLELSVIGRARRDGLLDVRLHDLRDWTLDRHRTVDDTPSGGGAGMVMKPDVWFAAAESVWNDVPAPGHAADVDAVPDLPFVAGGPRPRTVLLTPRGRPFDQALAAELAAEDRFVLLCGRYEGIDERVHGEVATDEVSIGDYVLAGGEAAALVVVEAVGRLVDGVLGNAASPQDESFADGLLEHPQYTRPATLRGLGIPKVLTSGDHAAVAAWRRDQSERLTADRRPDLIGPHEERGIVPLAWVRSKRDARVDDGWAEVVSIVELDDVIPDEALAGLDAFSHLEIVYRFHTLADDDVVTGARRPRSNPAWPEVGILAQRGSKRPNRIAVSTCEVLEVRDRSVVVRGLDAIDGSPVLDLKPVMAEFLPRGPVRQPQWSHELMAGYWDSPAAPDNES